jgi:hypothetical protein
MIGPTVEAGERELAIAMYLLRVGAGCYLCQGEVPGHLPGGVGVVLRDEPRQVRRSCKVVSWWFLICPDCLAQPDAPARVEAKARAELAAEN